eukprot:CAMPEP_0172182286 /NCGR_PEP_ID=MMETSP1050-20130122/18317_1 /TAXON_ID=233186 /ORGANISM="Cryptomonas curvata, Strain CCAP979/52" /LENGTH=58 /DNA_ID=CAMNT_0012855719 /DNA_START=214 /DNA_END=386 /DNA_ORIENTATION=+
MMQPGASAGVVSSGVAGVFPGGGMGGGLWGAGGASLAGASQPSSQALQLRSHTGFGPG